MELRCPAWWWWGKVGRAISCPSSQELLEFGLNIMELCCSLQQCANSQGDRRKGVFWLPILASELVQVEGLLAICGCYFCFVLWQHRHGTLPLSFVHTYEHVHTHTHTLEQDRWVSCRLSMFDWSGDRLQGSTTSHLILNILVVLVRILLRNRGVCVCM